MYSQLKFVCKSYLCRKIFLLLAAFYVLFTWAETTVPVRDTPLLWQETQVRWMPQMAFTGMTAFLNWQATDEELGQLRGLTLQGDFVVPSDKLGSNGKPALTLELDAVVTPDHLAKLAKCIQLRELTWFGVEMTPEVGETLAKLPNLQQLKLALIGSPTPSLKALPMLANLRFFQVPVVPPSELGLLAKHPLLTIVELRDSLPLRPLPGELRRERYDIWQEASTLQEAKQIERVIILPMSEYSKAIGEGTPPDHIPNAAMQRAVPISDTLRAAVAELPNLKAVEIRELWGGWPARMIEDPGMRQALISRHDVALNPVALNGESLLPPFAGFTTAIVLVVIAMQLFAQFDSSWSRTVPAFARPHLIVAALLMVVHLLISSIILILRGHVDFLPALSIAAVLPAVGVFIGALLSRRPMMLAVFIPLGFASLMATIVGSQFLFRSTNWNSYVNGGQLGLTIAILLVEFAAILWAGRSAMEWSLRLNEAGIPVGLGPIQTLQQFQMQRQKPSDHSTTGIAWSFRLFDRRVDSYLNGKSFTNRRRQWRAVEPSNWRTILSMCLVCPWLFVGVFTLTRNLLSGQVTSLASYGFYSVFLGSFSLAVGTLIIAGGCQMRRSVLGQELLRPMLREDMVKMLRTSIWIDLWPAVLLTLAYLIAIIFVHAWGPVAWSSPSWKSTLLGQVLLCLTLPIPVWGGALLLLTIPSVFWRAFLIILGVVFAFGVVQPVVMLTMSQPMQIGQSATIITLASCGLAGLCLIGGTTLVCWANRRLPQVEWGN